MTCTFDKKNINKLKFSIELIKDFNHEIIFYLEDKNLFLKLFSEDLLIKISFLNILDKDFNKKIVLDSINFYNIIKQVKNNEILILEFLDKLNCTIEKKNQNIISALDYDFFNDEKEKIKEYKSILNQDLKQTISLDFKEFFSSLKFLSEFDTYFKIDFLDKELHIKNCSADDDQLIFFVENQIIFYLDSTMLLKNKYIFEIQEILSLNKILKTWNEIYLSFDENHMIFFNDDFRIFIKRKNA